MENYSVLYNKESIEFVTVAREYLSFMESAKNISKENFIDKSLKILPLLYLKGILLSKVDEFDDEYLEKFVDESTWSYIQQIAAAKLDSDDEYTQIQDLSVVSNMDYLNIGLSEIYADIYQEMGDIIGAYRIGNDDSMMAALHYCQDNFESYWGVRILVLMKSLHKIKFNF